MTLFLAAAAETEIPGFLSGRWLAAAVILPPLVVWCAWAVVRAGSEDTTRAQRSARRALRRHLAGMARRGAPPTAGELETWRRDVIRLWKIESAAPSPAEVAARGGDALGALWLEAEEALYARAGRLPDDWLKRAAEAVGAVAVPPAPWPWPKRRRHWLPAAAMIGLALGVSANKIDAAESPAQSAAHRTSSYLVHPRDAAVRAVVRQSLGLVESPDPALMRLLEGAWYDRAAGKLSPAEWQRVARGMALVAGLGLTLGVVVVYRSRNPRVRRVVLGVALVATGVTGAAFCAVLRYGALADARAAFVVAAVEVKTIPSEVGARQTVANLTPGTIVVVDKSFLGWDRVIVREGVAGWIRTEQAVWLYRQRDDSRVSADYAFK